MKMRWWSVLAGLATVVAAQEVHASRILFLAASSTRSHMNFYTGIIDALADRGHQVTVQSPYRRSKARDNLREVVMADMRLTKFMSNPFDGHKFSSVFTVAGKIPTFCNDALARQETQDLLQEKFDLVLLVAGFSDCFLSVVHQLKVPYVYVFPNALGAPFAGLLGNPRFPSFSHNHAITASHPPSFLDRLMIIIYEAVMDVLYQNKLLAPMEEECHSRGLCPPDMPPFLDMHLNASLILINCVQTLQSPVQPYVPAVVPCGGIHCRPALPLPQELEEWVAGAGEAGFIFFSLGSAVTPSSMPEEYRRILVQVFGSLEQRVLWKWDQDAMEDLPPNVRLGKWLPQQDVLGHPRLRLFVTHGGLLSTQESMYHGVPVLGMPVFADQQTNMNGVERDGWGSVLLWEDLSAHKMREKIVSTMNDERMKAEAERRSAVFQDLPQAPGETAAYWVEYVIRHHGAPHLASPIASMPWYRLYNVDVWATLVAAVGLLLYASLRLLRAVCRWLCCPRHKTKRD